MTVIIRPGEASLEELGGAIWGGEANDGPSIL